MKREDAQPLNWAKGLLEGQRISLTCMASKLHIVNRHIKEDMLSEFLLQDLQALQTQLEVTQHKFELLRETLFPKQGAKNAASTQN